MNQLLDYNDALSAALTAISATKKQENVSLIEAAGRVLGDSINADRDLPPFNRAQMDGYALRAAEVGELTSWPVVETVSAGSNGKLDVPVGSCVKIATGAPLPADVDTVIQHELSDRNDPVSFTIDSIKQGNAVHPYGSDAKLGDHLVAKGTIIKAQHIAIAATVGKAKIAVIRRPCAIVLTSGDEILPADSPVEDHQIRNSNGPMLLELLKRIGAEPTQHIHIVDDAKLTTEAVRDAIANSDLVITIGGISAGDRDFFPPAFEELGVKATLRRAAIQPGKPIYVGQAPDNCVVVGLPGNPVSALSCTCIFIWPIVRKMLGLDPLLPWRKVELSHTVKANPKRRAFRPAILLNDGRAEVPNWAGSGDISHTAPTHGLLELPIKEEAVIEGTQLRFLPYP
ncbi:MAG: molybdopterin molybdotransferase MoeA [Planctomycetes bacterium]|nr:molybdopterin molybdotransferase MoeA [Planctomycetota bacterium]